MKTACWIGLTFFLGLSLAPASSAQVIMRSYVIGSGSIDAANDENRLRGTVGQPIVGTTTSPSAAIQAGFWPQIYSSGPSITPVAQDDHAYTEVNHAVDINVLRNDFDPGGSALIIVEFGNPSNGAVEQKSDSVLTYIPDNDFVGHDSFTYLIQNLSGATATASVRVAVGVTNSPPAFVSVPVTGVAVGDQYFYAIIVEDPDGEEIELAAAVLPSWLAFERGEGYSATISGSASIDHLGAHPVTILATDGIDTTYQSFTVTVVEGAPQVVELLFPSDGAIDVIEPLTLRWRAAAGATLYRLQVSTIRDFSSLTINVSEIADTTYLFAEPDPLTTYYWRVASANGAGESDFSTPFQFSTASPTSAESVEPLPAELQLAQNYPNPFGATTSIHFSLPSYSSSVSVTVYDLMGREIARLIDRAMDAGVHAVSFDGASVPSGVYIYQMRTGGQTISRQMVRMK